MMMMMMMIVMMMMMNQYQKGDRVEAKLKGWTKYYKGKITRENRDGTYDILFDDGERKSKVRSLEINHLKQKKKNHHQNQDAIKAVIMMIVMMMMMMI